MGVPVLLESGLMGRALADVRPPATLVFLR
jgi:hypothetical protein